MSSAQNAALQARAMRHLLRLLLILPWLFPFATGPSPSVLPWLFGLGCATLVWLGRASLSPQLVLEAWIGAAALSAGIGLLQYAGFSAELWPWVVHSPGSEAFGNLRQRNQFATLTSIGLVALLCIVAKNRDGALAYPGMASVLLAVLLATANAASSSRTGMLQLLLMAGLFWGWGLRGHAGLRMLLLWMLLAYGVATIALPQLIGAQLEEHGIWARLRQGEAVCNSRQPLWMNVLHLIALRPWTGWGWGELDYAHFITLYPGERFCEILDNAHNLPLHLAVELGVPLTALLATLAAVWVWRRRPWQEKDPGRQAAWAVIVLVGAHSLLEYPLWYAPFQISLALSLWLLGARNLKAAPMQAGIPKRELIGAVLVMSAAAYAAWDYHRVSQIYLPQEERSAAYRERTLEKIADSWLFSRQVRFAAFSITPLTQGNAQQLHDLGRDLLHYSPEPRVVEKLAESAMLLGRDDELRYYAARYRAAYPTEYARWIAAQPDLRPPRN